MQRDFSARLLVLHIGCVISVISATGSEEGEGKTEKATVSLLPAAAIGQLDCIFTLKY